MEKIQELVKEGKLAENLMADKEFVKGAKEIFKSEKIEIDNKKLAQLIKEIETQLNKGNVLDYKELEKVSGGMTKQEFDTLKFKRVEFYTTVAIGTIFAATGALIGANENVIKLSEKIKPLDGTPGTTRHKGAHLTRGFNLALSSSVGGVTIGLYLGKKLSRWICEKAGLKEE